MIPQSNATLTVVAEPPRTDTWDDAEVGAAASLWAGRVPCYYQEKRERVASAAESLLIRRTLIVEEGRPKVPAPTGQAEGGWKNDLAITFEYAGSTRTGVVQHVERRTLPGAGPVQTTRLTLEAL